jgi:hypothetical protein
MHRGDGHENDNVTIETTRVIEVKENLGAVNATIKYEKEKVKGPKGTLVLSNHLIVYECIRIDENFEVARDEKKGHHHGVSMLQSSMIKWERKYDGGKMNLKTNGSRKYHVGT